MGEPIYPVEKAKAREPVNPVSQLESGRAEGFSAWADVYDQRQNPLLSLEERYLLQLLPKIQGRDVLDIGCGTGRWLVQLSRLRPHSLHGVDPSPQMLARAAEKRIPHVRLSESSCTYLPVDDASVNLLLASFVLSYEADLDRAASELARAAKPGSDLFISDMHPETSIRLHWKRSFRIGEIEVQLQPIPRSIPEILDALKAAGFVERAIIEPAFGAPEQDIFTSHDKLQSFSEAGQLPAIYLLHLTKPHTSNAGSRKHNEKGLRHHLHGGQCALGPREKIASSLVIHAGNIETMSSSFSIIGAREDTDIDLTGYLLFPGLVNAHDHLEFSLFPRLGKGLYKNAAQWAQDIQQNDAEIIAAHRRISKRTRLWWGGIRNLLSGVTTVCHHNPLDPCFMEQEFPVRVVSRFGWEHSLPFGSDVQAAHRNTAVDQPFIIHCCEGIDEQSKEELSTLDALGVLDQRTVLVHGLTLDVEGATLLNTRGAALIACPSSNAFLFGRVPSQEVLESVRRLALGSDSPLTAVGTLLEEIRFVSDTYALSPQQLYSLVTDLPASILRLKNGEGSFRSGIPADLIAVRDRQGDPAELLCALSASDIELVLLSGRVQMASPDIFERLPPKDRANLQPLCVDGDIRWLRAPVHDLLQDAENVLGKGAVRLGGKLVCLPN